MDRLKKKKKNNESITLIDVKEYKQLVLNQLREQQAVVSTKAENIISPITDTGSTLMNSFNLGMVAFDTISMGIRAIRRFSGLFRRRRK